MKRTALAFTLSMLAIGCGSKDASTDASASAEPSSSARRHPKEKASDSAAESTSAAPVASGQDEKGEKGEKKEGKHGDGACTADKGPCDGEGTLSSGGKERTFLFHFPKSKSQKPGLVIALHGHGGMDEGFRKNTHFDRLGNESDYVIIYPQGFEKSWSSFDGKREAAKAGIDDVAFISALIDHGVNDFGADPAQVIVAGFSNGGIMAERIGCELADKVMAISPNSGTMPEAEAPVCKPAKPISVIMFHGDADKNVLFNGRPESAGSPKLLSAPDTIAKWAALNKCDPKPVVTDEPDTDPNDGTRVKRSTYSGCANNVHVVFFKVEGGIHAWSTGPSTEKKSEKEGISHDIDAGKLILELAKPG